MYTAIVQFVNAEFGSDVIRFKYIEKGHTFLKADSIHGIIGKAMKRAPIVATFDNFVDLCDDAGKNIKSDIDIDSMFQFRKEARTRSSKSVSPLSLLETILEVAFKKGSRSMYYKTSFEGKSIEVDFLRPRFSTNVFPQPALLPICIP